MQWSDPQISGISEVLFRCLSPVRDDQASPKIEGMIPTMDVREFTSQEEAHHTLLHEDPTEMVPYVVSRPDGKIDVGVYVPKSFDAYSQERLREMVFETISKVNVDPPPVLRGLTSKLGKIGETFRTKRPDELTRNQRKKLRQLGR